MEINTWKKPVRNLEMTRRAYALVRVKMHNEKALAKITKSSRHFELHFWYM